MFTALIAQEPPPQQRPPGENPMGILGNPLLLIALMGLFFVVIVLPQSRRQKKEQQAMLAALKPGAKILTTSGIYGTVVTVKDGDDEITLRSADSKLKVSRSSVARVIGTDDSTDTK